MIYRDVELQPGHDYLLKIDPVIRSFVYELLGEVSVQGETVKSAESCFTGQQSRLSIKAMTAARFMVYFGVPHNRRLINMVVSLINESKKWINMVVALIN